MKKLLFLLFPLAYTGYSFSQSAVDPKFMVGKWKMCSFVTKGDEVHKIDSSMTCEGTEWHLQLNEDHSTTLKHAFICEDSLIQNYGVWDFSAQRLSLKYDYGKCGRGEQTHSNIKILNPDLWYYKAVEGYTTRRKKTVFIHMYYVRVPD